MYGSQLPRVPGHATDSRIDRVRPSLPATYYLRTETVVGFGGGSPVTA